MNIYKKNDYQHKKNFKKNIIYFLVIFINTNDKIILL